MTQRSSARDRPAAKSLAISGGASSPSSSAAFLREAAAVCPACGAVRRPSSDPLAIALPLPKLSLEMGAAFLERSGLLPWNLHFSVTRELVEDLVSVLTQASAKQSAAHTAMPSLAKRNSAPPPTVGRQKRHRVPKRGRRVSR